MDRVAIEAIQLGHPLLQDKACVRNDYSIGIKGNAHIITGSNMAGKSTFIRAVGLNVVLALNGLPVCATKFSCSLLTLASCIRITDSLEDNASYFKAELLRLQQIMTMIRTGKPHLILLDEIMRGTNSDDKRMGTLAFYRKLKDFNCLALLATHDLAIGQLEVQHPDHFENYCFESTVEGKEIRFDYRLRRGVSTSTNASVLMRNLDLIE
jgi:DNA mismatch repair ATPase MutS